ncbi:hypothetical protein Cgig2_005843 [Carnegiea gigantea]|uniref:Zinc knuckle CX2CX4HX4C domain-containing protein n=1 Tax=Carnegiea gigantea TaxID=171969 RepID=A0A9Q1KPG1_9CARY|nr:hypothetical protein Cgig2_005843 [Carnegiea gigantea]
MYGVDKSLCFRVDIDISKPLKRGHKMMVGGKLVWVDFRYVKLPDFSYLCGMLGHITKGCDYYNPDVPESEYYMGAPKARTQLNFGESPTPLIPVEITDQRGKEGQNHNTGTDQMDILIPGNEVFKRKHEGHDPTMGVGLALLWEKSIKLSLCSYSSNHMDANISWEGEDVEWRFTGIYRWPETQNKLRTGEIIADLATHSNFPWVIFFHAEKNGGPAKPQRHINSFREAFTDANLNDLGFEDYPFTWSRVQHEEVIVEKRLDRFCASTEWSLLFPEAQVTHVNSYISYHLPILLKCYPTNLSRQRHGKKFKFENMWVTDPSCREIIGDVSKTDAVDNVLVKVDSCSKELAAWNKNSFGHVGREISKLEDSLKYLTDAKSWHGVLNKIK